VSIADGVGYIPVYTFFDLIFIQSKKAAGLSCPIETN
jgi:hypothetical protein